MRALEADAGSPGLPHASRSRVPASRPGARRRAGAARSRPSSGCADRDGPGAAPSWDSAGTPASDAARPARRSPGVAGIRRGRARRRAVDVPRLERRDTRRRLVRASGPARPRGSRRRRGTLGNDRRSAVAGPRHRRVGRRRARRDPARAPGVVRRSRPGEQRMIASGRGGTARRGRRRLGRRAARGQSTSASRRRRRHAGRLVRMPTVRKRLVNVRQRAPASRRHSTSATSHGAGRLRVSSVIDGDALGRDLGYLGIAREDVPARPQLAGELLGSACARRCEWLRKRDVAVRSS